MSCVIPLMSIAVRAERMASAYSANLCFIYYCISLIVYNSIFTIGKNRGVIILFWRGDERSCMNSSGDQYVSSAVLPHVPGIPSSRGSSHAVRHPLLTRISANRRGGS